MQRHKSAGYVVVTSMVAICGVVATRAQNATSGIPVPPLPVADRPAKSPIEGYRSWVKANAKPHPVISEIALLCTVPTKKQIEEDRTNPHLDPNLTGSPLRMRYVTVYVNKIAERAMLREKTPHFAEGSCIVKERLATPTSKVPEVITVMQKRESGYNPSHGDWEFRVMDGAGKVVQADGKLKFCEGCHSAWKDNDYVSRAYLNSQKFAGL